MIKNDTTFCWCAVLVVITLASNPGPYHFDLPDLQEGVRSAHQTDLCFSICRFSEVVFILRAQPHAQSLFLFPIVFGINLIHIFNEKKDGAAGISIVCFGASIPGHAI